jgi:hypothetical protein
MKLTYQAKDVDGVLKPLDHCMAKVAVGLSRFKSNEILDVTVQRRQNRRSLAQNSFYWSVLVPIFAEWTGDQEFSKQAELDGIAPEDSAHAILKAMFIGRRTITLPDGTTVEVEPSTKSLTVAEFAKLTEDVERFLVSHGFRIPADER